MAHALGSPFVFEILESAEAVARSSSQESQQVCTAADLSWGRGEWVPLRLAFEKSSARRRGALEADSDSDSDDAVWCRSLSRESVPEEPTKNARKRMPARVPDSSRSSEVACFLASDGKVRGPNQPSVSYRSPRAFQAGATWQPHRNGSTQPCFLRHFGQSKLKSCLAERGVRFLLLSGDSIVAGFTAFLKWLLGTYVMGQAWYGEGKQIAPDTVQHERGDTLIAGTVQVHPTGGKYADVRTHARQFYKELLKRRSADDGPVVCCFNSNIQHVVWGQTSAKVRRNARDFGDELRLLREERGFDDGLLIIFFTGVATHGFREPHCTSERSRAFSEIIYEALKPARVERLDAFRVTQARPDGAIDGMHYGDDTNYIFVQLLANLVCPAKPHRGGRQLTTKRAPPPPAPGR